MARSIGNAARAATNAAPLASAVSSAASHSTTRAIAQTDAPSAIRTANSRRRADICTSRRPATFAAAAVRRSATAASNAHNRIRAEPIASSTRGAIVEAMRPVRPYATASSRTMRSTSDWAASIGTPALRRPTTSSTLTSRLSTKSGSPGMGNRSTAGTIATHASGRSGYVNAGGMMPTIVYRRRPSKRIVQSRADRRRTAAARIRGSARWQAPRRGGRRPLSACDRPPPARRARRRSCRTPRDTRQARVRRPAACPSNSTKRSRRDRRSCAPASASR